MRSFAQFLAENIRDISDEVIQRVLDLLTPEELASLDNPSPETNKKIFRRLARELHPDITGKPMGDVENAALRIFGKDEASNAKTFNRLKQVKQTTQASAQAEAGRPKTADEVRAEANAQRRKEWQEGEAWSREERERVKREAQAREQARADKAKADAQEAERARVGRKQAEAAKKAKSGQTAQPQTPPQPPPSIQDEVSSAAAQGEQNAAQRFGRKAIDTTKKIVGEFAQGAKKEAISIGRDLSQGGFGIGGGKAPVSVTSRVLPIGAGADLALKIGMDLYDMHKDPLWIYKPPTYSDAIKNELIGVGISTAAGAGIGALLGGAPGAGAGAVAGAVEGIATASYGLAQVPMKMGYSERQTLNNLKSRLDTTKTLQKNNPTLDYTEIISNLENAISQMEQGESVESKLSKGVDAAVRSIGLSSSDAEVAARETRTPEQLRAEAEAAFAERYPQGIRGGLAPGKSAAEVEKEAATDIINRLNAGAKPEDLSKELGWEKDHVEKFRQKRVQKEVELMVSDPEKYGKMSEDQLSAAAGEKVLDELRKTIDAELIGYARRREQEDADRKAKIAAEKAVEDAQDAQQAYERQQIKDALAKKIAINQGLANERRAAESKRKADLATIDAENAVQRAKTEAEIAKKREQEKRQENVNRYLDRKNFKTDAERTDFLKRMSKEERAMLVKELNRPIETRYQPEPQPQEKVRRSKYGHLVSDGEGWGG
jgi:hypothetical protein